jgi:hypothetical protein
VLFRIEAIKPKRKDAAKIFKKYYEAALRETADEVRDDLEATTQTWEHRVKFVVRVVKRSGVLGITVSTKDVIYAYVNYGTKAHVIRPKRAKVLRFQSGHTAKTRPGFIGSTPGGVSGGAVFAQEVHHPGSAPRGFDIAIARRRQKSLQSRMDHAMALAQRELEK